MKNIFGLILFTLSVLLVFSVVTLNMFTVGDALADNSTPTDNNTPCDKIPDWGSIFTGGGVPCWGVGGNCCYD